MRTRIKRIMSAALAAAMVTSAAPQLTSVVGYAAEETVTLTAPSNVRGYYNAIIWDAPDDENVSIYYYELTYNGDTSKLRTYKDGITLLDGRYGEYILKLYSEDSDGNLSAPVEYTYNYTVDCEDSWEMCLTYDGNRSVSANNYILSDTENISHSSIQLYYGDYQVDSLFVSSSEFSEERIEDSCDIRNSIDHYALTNGGLDGDVPITAKYKILHNSLGWLTVAHSSDTYTYKYNNPDKNKWNANISVDKNTGNLSITDYPFDTTDSASRSQHGNYRVYISDTPDAEVAENIGYWYVYKDEEDKKSFNLPATLARYQLENGGKDYTGDKYIFLRAYDYNSSYSTDIRVARSESFEYTVTAPETIDTIASPEVTIDENYIRWTEVEDAVAYICYLSASETYPDVVENHIKVYFPEAAYDGKYSCDYSLSPDNYVNGRYYYKVVAVDKDGNFSEPSIIEYDVKYEDEQDYDPNFSYNEDNGLLAWDQYYDNGRTSAAYFYGYEDNFTQYTFNEYHGSSYTGRKRNNTMFNLPKALAEFYYDRPNSEINDGLLSITITHERNKDVYSSEFLTIPYDGCDEIDTIDPPTGVIRTGDSILWHGSIDAVGYIYGPVDDETGMPEYVWSQSSNAGDSHYVSISYDAGDYAVAAVDKNGDRTEFVTAKRVDTDYTSGLKLQDGNFVFSGLDDSAAKVFEDAGFPIQGYNICDGDGRTNLVTVENGVTSVSEGDVLTALARELMNYETQGYEQYLYSGKLYVSPLAQIFQNQSTDMMNKDFSTTNVAQDNTSFEYAYDGCDEVTTISAPTNFAFGDSALVFDRVDGAVGYIYQLSSNGTTYNNYHYSITADEDLPKYTYYNKLRIASVDENGDRSAFVEVDLTTLPSLQEEADDINSADMSDKDISVEPMDGMMDMTVAGEDLAASSSDWTPQISYDASTKTITWKNAPFTGLTGSGDYLGYYYIDMVDPISNSTINWKYHSERVYDDGTDTYTYDLRVPFAHAYMNYGVAGEYYPRIRFYDSIARTWKTYVSDTLIDLGKSQQTSDIAAPTGVTAVNGGKDDNGYNVSVYFDENEDAVGYIVKYATPYGFYYDTVNAGVTESSLLMRYIGCEMHISVASIDKYGNRGAFSDYVEVDTRKEPVSSPVVTATPGHASVSLKWDAVDGATRYSVEIYENGTYTSCTSTLTATSYIVKDLTIGKEYTFLVKAFVNGSWTEYSTNDHVKATPVDLTKPVVTATEGNGVVTLNWKAIEGATAYRIRRHDGTSWATLATISETTYNDTAVKNGTKYTYAVLSKVDGVWSNPSEFVTATPHVSYECVPPANVKAVAGDGEVTITWDAVEGATAYRVRRNDGTKWATIATVTEPVYNDTTVTNGTEYTYGIHAQVNGTWSSASTLVTATPEEIKCVPPTGVKATAGDGVVDITWNAVHGATAYRVRRNDGSAWTTLGNVTTTSYKDTAVTNGTKYTYGIFAQVNGEWSAASELVTSIPAGFECVPPTGVKATGDDGVITVTWNAVDGATAYRVRRNDGTAWTTLGNVTATSYKDTAVTNGTKYTYGIFAQVDGKWSAASELVTATPAAPFECVPPTGVKATGDDGVITVTWNAVEGATAYRVRRNDGSVWATLGNVTATSYKDTAVTNGTKYTYGIFAQVNGTWSAASALVTATPEAIECIPPASVTIKSESGKISLEWNAVNGATKYRVRRSDGNGWTNLASVSGTSYTDTAVTNGTNYVYGIFAYVEGAWSAASALVQAKPAAVVSGVANNLTITTTADSITLSWDAVDGAEKYRVRRSDGVAWATKQTSAKTTFVDTDVVAGTTYKYSIYCDSDGAFGAPSSTVAAIL